MSQLQEQTPFWNGIKLRFLVDWSKQQGFTPSITTREVCEKCVKLSTEATQLSYCEQLLLSEDAAEFVGRPTAFISHAWDYRFLEVLEALTSYFADEEDVIIWFDIFSNNQHKTASFEFEWWCDTFKDAILSFGRTVMVLAPWNDPLPLRRAWCIWELYCTIEGKRSDLKCRFDVAMSPASIEQFVADVDADPANVTNKMLATIDTARSECSKAEDRERIHDAIRRTVGFNELNREIFEIMRGWVISKYEARYKALQGVCEPQTRIICMNNLASLFYNQGEFGKSLPLFEECLTMTKAVLGDNHPDTLTSMNNLAGLYKNLGEFGKSLQLYEECLRRMNVALGEDHPDTLSSMSNLANLYSTQGEYARALLLTEECLRKRKVVLGENHPGTLSSMNVLGILYSDRGEYGNALPYFEDCLRMRKVVLGENHPDTLISVNNLANLYSNQGEYAKALPLLEECLTMSKVLFGDSHPGTLTSMNNLASLYFHQGNFGKALPLVEEGLTMSKVVLGETHPDTLSSMNNLAGLYKNIGEFVKALMLYEECLRMRMIVLGANHPGTLSSMNNLASLYMSQGEFGKALPLYEECLRMRRAILGDYHHDTLSSMMNLVKCQNLLSTSFVPG